MEPKTPLHQFVRLVAARMEANQTNLAETLRLMELLRDTLTNKIKEHTDAATDS
jgi:hypothetical protein